MTRGQRDTEHQAVDEYISAERGEQSDPPGGAFAERSEPDRDKDAPGAAGDGRKRRFAMNQVRQQLTRGRGEDPPPVRAGIGVATDRTP